MILTDSQIRKSVEDGELEITDFSPDRVEPASYDMRVGKQGFTTTTREIINLEERGIIILEPGDFGVVTTLEKLELPRNMAARIGVRSGLTRKGVFCATGPQIDPGYRGILSIGMVNLSPNPIVLAYKDPFLTIEFHRLNEPASRGYDGPYQGLSELSSRDIDHLIESKGMAYSEVIRTLSTLSENVAKISTEFSSFKEALNARITSFGWIMGGSVGMLSIAVAIIGIVAVLK